MNSDLLYHFPALSLHVVSQVVRFSDNDTEKASSGDAPIIINCSSEQEDRVDDNPKTGILQICICFLSCSDVITDLYS